MTDAPAPPEVRLWTQEGFRDDEWTHAESAEALAGNGRFILPLGVAAGLDPTARQSARERIGLLVQPGDKIDAVVELLGDVSLVALAFPAFNDGRSFSKASLLRERHGYAGPLRAAGQVLIDQLPHMLRVGFDEFEVSHPVLLKRLQSGQLDGLDLFYQPAAKAADKAGKYSWRRR